MPIKVSVNTELWEEVVLPRSRGRVGIDARPAERSAQRKTVVPPNELRDPIARARSTRIVVPQHDVETFISRRCRWNPDYL